MCMFQCGTSASSAWCPRKLMDRSGPTSPPWPGGREWSMETFIIPPASNRHPYLDIIKSWVSDTLALMWIYIHWYGHIALNVFTSGKGIACMNWRNLENYVLNFFFFLLSGLLFKRSTLLLPTKERLKFIFSKISQVSRGAYTKQYNALILIN